MTHEDHNRMLGIMHLIYGGAHVLIALLAVLFYVVMLVALAGEPYAPGLHEGFFGVFLSVLLGFYILLNTAPLVAGYGLLKRKSWARLLTIISSFVAAGNVPVGTALCVYSLWFIFGEGKSFYDSHAFRPAGRGALNDASSTFDEAWYAQEARRRQQRDSAYVPPPPDWRGQ